MRFHSILVLPVLLALAACNAPGGGNNQLPATPADDVGGNSGSPGAGAAAGNESAGIAEFRSRWLEACIGGGRDAAPPGTPVDRHCACAIDRVMAGKSLEELEADRASGAYRSRFSAEMRACIREIRS